MSLNLFKFHLNLFKLRIWLRFWGSLGKRITCVWEWLIACICKQSRCKMSTNRYKLQWAIPLEALVASLKAVLFSICEHFDRLETPCFSYSIFAIIEACSFPKISDATKNLTVFLVLSVSDAWQTIWSNHLFGTRNMNSLTRHVQRLTRSA